MTTIDVNLTARDAQVGEPWIWRLSKDFDIKVTLVKANIESDFGLVQVRLEGPLEEVQRAVTWLMTTGLHVDTLQRSVGA